MIEIPVEDVMTRSARPLEPETPISEAAQRLRDPDVSALVVLEDDAVVGIVTESDVVAFVAETLEPHPAEAIMSSPVTTISPAEPVTAAIETMRAAGVKHLPVVRGECYRGLVSASTLAPYLSRRRLEIEWQDDPIRIGGDSSAVTVGE